MNPTRITRLVQLLGLLQGGRGFGAAALARHCSVTRRTIFRDLEVLRQAGVPVAYDPQLECYSVPGAFYLPPTNFTAEEALAVMILCHELGGDRALPFYAAARSAAVKLENSLPAALRDQLKQVGNAVNIQIAAHNPLADGKSHYDQLLGAIAARRCVRVEYAAPTDPQPFSTRLSPYRLLFSRHSWYVVGRSSLHREVRMFNLGRVRSLIMLDQSYRIPQRFSIEAYLGNAWNLIREAGPDRDVHLRFAPQVARNVAEVIWHKTQRTEVLPDGSLDFRVTVAGLNEISWWILGYGDLARVMSPVALQDLIRQRAQRMLAQYDESPSTRKDEESDLAFAPPHFPKLAAGTTQRSDAASPKSP